MSRSSGNRSRRRDRLSDAQLSRCSAARTVGQWWRGSVDRLAGSDPGLTRLRLALQTVLSVGLTMAVVYVMVRTTGELEISASSAPAAVVAAQNHAAVVVAMMVGSIMALMSSFTVNDATSRAQLVTSALLPLPMTGALAAGFAFGPHRLLSLGWLLVALVVGVYLRRFGPRGVAVGLVLFQGAFMGFFLHTVFGWRDLGWLVADMALGLLASTFVRLVILRTDATHTLVRMRRSWLARASRVLRLSVRVVEAQDPGAHARATEQLRRQLIRLNESTLMLDAYLGDPSIASWAAAAHQRLFDHELSLVNVARFAGALSARDLPPDVLSAVRSQLSALRDDNLADAEQAAQRLRALSSGLIDPRTSLLLQRLATSARILAEARAAERSAYSVIPGSEASDHPVTGWVSPFEDEPETFTSAVTLQAGWLPGSAEISAAASTTRGSRLLDRTVLAPHVRASIQMAVAATLALVVGDRISQQRLYWAALAVFLSFMATTNSGEQVRKAVGRAIGTAVGIVVGDVLVHVTRGQPTVSILTVLVALFLGVYLMRISYGFMAMSITVATAQLYDQLDEFSWHLLLLRLAENCVGVGAVILTVLFVVPLRPQRVLTAGLLAYFLSLRTVVLAALQRLLEPGAAPPTRADLRALDAAYASLNVTAKPLQWGLFVRYSGPIPELLAIAGACRTYARTLTIGVHHWPAVANAQRDALTAAVEQTRSSLSAIETRLREGPRGPYIRAAGLFQPLSNHIDSPRVLRDLMLLDAALAKFAEGLGMPVTDHDTTTSAAH
jgi:uncharacterized membrane protein YgaE (UPF0421/DUF939 family)